MYVDEGRVRDAERAWGVPGERTFRVETSDAELAFIRRTQKRGRSHDVTVLIGRAADERYAVISKHDYPEGAWRPPSGGLEPGESIGEGACRECREETGLEIEIERYLLRARVTFEPRPDSAAAPIEWTSHVLGATAIGGTLDPIDRGEIRGAAWIGRDDLLGPVRERLLEKDAAGIRYRVALHEAIFAALDRTPATGDSTEEER